jgi:multicomponent Na+:H+ antiporter subunit G
MSNWAGMILLGIGILFNILGCIGLIRLPDTYNRLQAAAKCVTMGTCLVLLGVVILSGFGEHAPLSAKCLLCLVFVLITSPTAADALAKGAHASGVKLWQGSVVDKYEEDHPSKGENKETP